jgi:hypothetical protein
MADSARQAARDEQIVKYGGAQWGLRLHSGGGMPESYARQYSRAAVIGAGASPLNTGGQFATRYAVPSTTSAMYGGGV